MTKVLLRGHLPCDAQPRCTVCGAFLASGNDGHRCSCHRLPPKETQYNPRHDPHAEKKVLEALRLAVPGVPVDLRYVLGCEDRTAIHDVILRLRANGYHIEGCRPVGYRLILRRDTGQRAAC